MNIQKNKIRTFKINNIDWDNDQQDTSHLPTSKVVKVILQGDITEDEIENFVADMLSDNEGWCVMSFEIEEVL